MRDSFRERLEESLRESSKESLEEVLRESSREEGHSKSSHLEVANWRSHGKRKLVREPVRELVRELEIERDL